MSGITACDAAARQVAVADFAALGRTHHAGLTDRERREVVVQHERLAALAFERVDDLRIAAGAERGGDQRLRLAAGEQRRTVRARQHADLDGDRTHGAQIAAVDARLAVEDALAHDVALELEELVDRPASAVHFAALAARPARRPASFLISARRRGALRSSR